MGDLAHGLAHEPRLRHGLQHAGRRREDEHDEVGHSQVDDEQVGHALHVPAPQHHEADEEVAHHAYGEDDQVQDDEQPLHGRRVDIVSHAVSQLRNAARVGLAEAEAILCVVVPVVGVVVPGLRVVWGGEEGGRGRGWEEGGLWGIGGEVGGERRYRRGHHVADGSAGGDPGVAVSSTAALAVQFKLHSKLPVEMVENFEKAFQQCRLFIVISFSTHGSNQRTAP